MNIKGTLLRIIVPALTVVFTFVAVELLLRLPGFSGFKDFEPTLFGDALAYRPNQVARHRLGSDFDTEIRINSRGFRDDEFDASTAMRTAVAVGDSFTEGWGVDLDESWVKQLQTHLAGDYAHVYNGGRSGTNPKNYAGVYREFFAKDSHVDTVILGLCLGNDIIDATTPDFRVSPPLTLTTRIKIFAMKYSVLYNLARRSLRYNPRVEKFLSKLGLTTPPEIQRDFSSSEDNRRRWPYTAEYLSQFGASVEASGRRVLIVLIPTKELAIDSYFEVLMKHTGSGPEDVDRFGFRDEVLTRLQADHIPVLDLTPTFRNPETGQASDYYFQGDGHWSAAGHRLAAIKIAEKLQQIPVPTKNSTPADTPSATALSVNAKERG